MRSALAFMLVLVHLSWGADGFDRIERPHVGTVRHTGSIPVASTTTSAPFTLQLLQRPSRAYRTPNAARQLTVLIYHETHNNKTELRCLMTLWTRESNFRPQALNKHSGAGGIPQILGLSPDTSTRYQIERGLDYITHRYDTPCRALAHHNRHGWY